MYKINVWLPTLPEPWCNFELRAPLKLTERGNGRNIFRLTFFGTRKLVALTDAPHKNRKRVFCINEKEETSRSFFPKKVLNSLNSTFSWLFLLVCFDTKPLFLKVKKVKKRCSAGHRNLLLHTSSFKKPKQFGFYIWKDFFGLFYFPDFLHSFRLTSKSKYFANQLNLLPKETFS